MLLTATPASRIALVKEAALCHEGVGAQAASGVGPQPAGPLSLSHQLAQQLQSLVAQYSWLPPQLRPDGTRYHALKQACCFLCFAKAKIND